MERAARPTGPLALRIGVAAAVTALAAAALPAAASAASITIGANAPANGANLKTIASTTPTPIDVAADVTGCANPQAAPLILSGPTQPGVAPVPLVNGSATLTQRWKAVAKKRSVVWTVALLCDGQNPIGGENRTLNLIPGSVHPKLDGRFVLNMLVGKKGKRRFTKPTRLTFFSSKKAGVFRSRDNFKDVWNYNKKTKRYRMRTRFRSSCQVGGRTISGGSTETFVFNTKVRKTDVTKGQRFVKSMSGTWTYVQKPTSKGRAAGCRLAKSSGRAILVRKGKVVV